MRRTVPCSRWMSCLKARTPNPGLAARAREAARQTTFAHRELRALDEVATSAWYAGRLREGREACQRLLAGELPAEERRRVERNLTCYLGLARRPTSEEPAGAVEDPVR